MLGSPLCVKMGSGFGCRLRLSGGNSSVLGWEVGYARLVSRTSGQVYWTVNDPGVGNLISPSATYSLPNIPSLVDYARLEMSFVIYYWGPWGPVYYITPPYSSEEVFIVLDEPKAPMSPARVSVLRKSCDWAKGESTQDGAARKLTIELHKNGNYDGGLEAYTRLPSDPDTGETLYLMEYLKTGRFEGQCNDFADFLVYLMTSVGIPRAAQRTHPLVNSCRIVTLPNGNQGLLLGFETRPLDAAPNLRGLPLTTGLLSGLITNFVWIGGHQKFGTATSPSCR